MIATTVQRTRILTIIITVFVMNTTPEKIAPNIQESVILFVKRVVDPTPVTVSLVWRTLTWTIMNSAPAARTGTALLVKYGLAHVTYVVINVLVPTLVIARSALKMPSLIQMDCVFVVITGVDMPAQNGQVLVMKRVLGVLDQLR